MLVTTYFEPTVENAPCPPFFVENVYEIFIITAENSGLNATVTEAVWDKCVEQYPQLQVTTTTTTQTTTPTTTTEQTTTSTTTSTTEQTTTSTTPTTVEQTTTSTTPTTVTEQTTTSTTTSTTEQTTTSTTPTTVEQTTTSTTPTTVTEQTTTSTTSTTAEQTTTSTTTTTTEQTTNSSTPTTTEQTTTSTTTTTTEQTTNSSMPTTAEQTTTSTASTKAEQTTTSTTPTTAEQTTTSSTPTAVTEQTTTSTTPTTAEQTTTSSTPTAVTEQTTTSTTLTSAIEQTTTFTTSTKKTQEQTSTPELTIISKISSPTTSTPTDNGKTNSTATLSSTINTKLTQQTLRSSAPLSTFSVTTEFTKLSTDITTIQASLTKCDTSCLVGSVLFCVSLLVGIIVAVKCLNAKRKKKHRFKHSVPKHKIDRGGSGKYIPKFPNINRHAYLNSAPLAFVNPTFIEHNGFLPVSHAMKTEKLHRRTPAQERRHRQNTFLDEDLRNGQFFFYQRKHSDHIDVCRTSSPNRIRHVDPYKRSTQIHNHLPSTMNSYVPKVIMPNENEYSFGIIKFDSNSGLPKIDIDHNENDIEVPDYPGSNGQQNDAFYEEKNSLDKEKVKTDSEEMKSNKEINSIEKNHGLPRISFDGTGDNESFYASTVHHCLPRTAIDASLGFTDVSKMASNEYLLYNGQNKHDAPNVYDSYNSVG